MNRTPPSRAPRLILSLALGLTLVVAAIFLGLYVLLVKAPAAAANQGYDLARRISQDLERQFHLRPHITVDSHVFIEGDTATLELATVSRRFLHEYTLSHEWAGSTKTLVLRGEFIAKAGYNLREPFSIDISSDGRSVKARLPSPHLLSLEETRESVLQDASGFWNWLTPEDRTAAKNNLLTAARKTMEDSDLTSAAEAGLVLEIERTTGRSIVVEHSPSPSSTSPRGDARPLAISIY